MVAGQEAEWLLTDQDFIKMGENIQELGMVEG